MRRLVVAAAVIAACVGAVAAGVVVGGEASWFLLAGLQIGPFLLLAVFVQLGEKRCWARVLAYLWLAGLVVALSVLALGLTWAALEKSAGGSGVAAVSGGLARMTLGLLLSLALATPFLFGRVRRLAARVLPVDPASLTHKVALVFVVFFTALSLSHLAALDWRPSLLTAVEGLSAEQIADRRSAVGQILDMFYGLAWTLPMAAVAAGYPVRRSLRGAILRLGLTLPSRRQVLVGLAMAAGLVAVFEGVDQSITWAWEQMGWPTTDVETFKKLVGVGFSPVGAVAIGITAGVGEEVTVRGLLQPRLGKVLPNLAFVAAHAFQYGPDALIGVFLLGMVFAFVRSYSSTSVAALVHGVYDFIAVMLEVLGF